MKGIRGRVRLIIGARVPLCSTSSRPPTLWPQSTPCPVHSAHQRMHATPRPHCTPVHSAPVQQLIHVRQCTHTHAHTRMPNCPWLHPTTQGYRCREPLLQMKRAATQKHRDDSQAITVQVRPQRSSVPLCCMPSAQPPAAWAFCLLACLPCMPCSAPAQLWVPRWGWQRPMLCSSRAGLAPRSALTSVSMAGWGAAYFEPGPAHHCPHAPRPYLPSLSCALRLTLLCSSSCIWQSGCRREGGWVVIPWGCS